MEIFDQFALGHVSVLFAPNDPLVHGCGDNLD